MEPLLDVFRDNKCFKDTAPQIMSMKLVRGLDVQKGTQQPCIKKIELGLFDDALIEIFMMGFEQKNNKTGFKYGYP